MKTTNTMKRFISVFLLSAFLIITASLSACSHYKFPWVYRIDVEQGNIIGEDEFEQLTVGMTQSQVKFLLGSPLIEDTFNNNRWDYYYSMRTGKGLFTRGRITLMFEGDALASIDRKEYDDTKLNY